VTGPIGVGCDLVSPEEIRYSIAAFGDRYLRRVFTERELADCTGPDRALRLAARYAAKEAAVKALAITDGPTPPHDIETVLNGPIPSIRLHGVIAERARALGYEHLTVSLSHTECHAMAVVLCAATIDPIRLTLP
jgi:holo-[acyl-carrier protein] synthase